jgi:hypothetical protein
LYVVESEGAVVAFFLPNALVRAVIRTFAGGDIRMLEGIKKFAFRDKVFTSGIPLRPSP